MQSEKWRTGREDQLRKWVRIASLDRARWVEHAQGGTIGHPDCWIPRDGQQCTFLELKIGSIKGGLLHYDVRPDQKGCLRAMRDDGCAVGLLIGIAGTRMAAFGPADDERLSGQVEALGLSDPARWFVGDMLIANDFWRGVGFIG